MQKAILITYSRESIDRISVEEVNDEWDMSISPYEDDSLSFCVGSNQSLIEKDDFEFNYGSMEELYNAINCQEYGNACFANEDKTGFFKRINKEHFPS